MKTSMGSKGMAKSDSNPMMAPKSSLAKQKAGGVASPTKAPGKGAKSPTKMNTPRNKSC